jgi:phosphatidylserine/phosphatidylglycerophosphate/cardiolipin synthase-like enzyme
MGVSLSASDLNSVDPVNQAALLSYLNLPPVGGLADRAGPVDQTTNGGYELPSDQRQVLLQRRTRLGVYRSLGELLDIDGFGPAALATVIDKLSDLPRYGNRLRPVWGGPEGEREFFQLLEGATRYIHISTFIIGGRAGLRLADLLARKVKEGVKVRLMFCASGFVISGSPSGTGFVSRWSAVRSWAVNDMYARRNIVRRLNEGGVPFLNNAPIGRHWKRKSFKEQGTRSCAGYQRWARERGIPDPWIDEQVRIDAECGLAFANVDHRKMVVVDGDRAFIGSQNIADSYFYSNELSLDPKLNIRNWQWQDNSSILEGPAVQEMGRLFAMRWSLSGGDLFDWKDSFYAPVARRVGNAIVTVESSIPGVLRVPFWKNFSRLTRSCLGADARPLSVGEHPIRARLWQMPALAENDFYVQHCYPSDSSLLTHWASVAPRVKDFTMVVPFHYDTKVLGMECDRMYPELIAANIRVLGYGRAILHSKISVMDGWYTATGSYNLTLRSARADLELEFFVQCPEYGAAVRQRIREDLEFCRPVAPRALARFRSRFSLPLFDAVVRYFIL